MNAYDSEKLLREVDAMFGFTREQVEGWQRSVEEARSAALALVGCEKRDAVRAIRAVMLAHEIKAEDVETDTTDPLIPRGTKAK